jgi:hypothetical protein
VSNVTKTPLSAIVPVDYLFDVMGIVNTNPKKSFENGLYINDSSFLKNIISTSTKSNTKFYLKDSKLFENNFHTKSIEYITETINTPLQLGEIFVNFKYFDTDFFALSGDYYTYDTVGETLMSENEDLLTISIVDKNKCTISKEKDGKVFNLRCFSDGSCIFYTQEEPTVFDFLYSTEDQWMSFSTMIDGNLYFLTKINNKLVGVLLNSGNMSEYLNNHFKISKQIYNNVDYPSNDLVRNYKNDLTVDQDEKNPSNQLMYRTDENMSLLFLKNSLNQNGTFSSTVNELSSNAHFKVSNVRRYTSINSDIDRYKDNELSLNYVFGNQEYYIKPGKNLFTTPTDMYPYTNMNINDTLFIKCGAYAHSSPDFSDRVYKYDENTIINNQHLLCTWLSGNGESSLWVDRYYYPDLVSKENALSGNSIFYSTYDTEIEKLINNNISFKESVIKVPFFDKKSDLCFTSNETYVYDRIDENRFAKLSTIKYDPCTISTNYFKEINKQGQFTLSFYFVGDNSSWSLSSNRNDINGGVICNKNGNTFDAEVRLYDPSTRTIESFSITENIRLQKINFVSIGIDALNGVGYFWLNDQIVQMFKFTQMQYVNKNILFGDIIFSNENVFDLRILSEYIPPKNVSIYPILDGYEIIDDITISLPNNTRNSVDVIELIQNICDSSAFKANIIDIVLSNVDIDDTDLNTLKEGIKKKMANQIPLTTEIRNIQIV